MSGRPWVFVWRSVIPASPEAVFAWHERPEVLAELTPPWAPVRVLQPPPSLRDGARAVLRMGVGPLSVTWVAEHRDYQAGRQFRDVQIEGPFRAWVHTHRFMREGPDACLLEDHIEIVPPGGALGRALAPAALWPQLALLFRYRHRVTRAAFEGG